MAKAFIPVIAIASLFANPAWGSEGLPRNVAGGVISDRWIQPGESVWINPDSWVHIYQHHFHQVDGPHLTVDLPDPPSVEVATEPVAEEPPAPAPEAPAPEAKPASKKSSSSSKKAATKPPAPAPEAPAPEAPTASADAPQE